MNPVILHLSAPVLLASAFDVRFLWALAFFGIFYLVGNWAGSQASIDIVADYLDECYKASPENGSFERHLLGLSSQSRRLADNKTPFGRFAGLLCLAEQRRVKRLISVPAPSVTELSESLGTESDGEPSGPPPLVFREAGHAKNKPLEK